MKTISKYPPSETYFLLNPKVTSHKKILKYAIMDALFRNVLELEIENKSYTIPLTKVKFNKRSVKIKKGKNYKKHSLNYLDQLFGQLFSTGKKLVQVPFLSCAMKVLGKRLYLII